MLKKNYAAWQINPDEFSEAWPDSKKLEFFARYAILAPSGHNSQPWELLLQRETLGVTVNQSHHLAADGSGLLSVEPYISIGTFLEIFTMAARGFGYNVTVNLFPRHNFVAEMSVEKKIAPEPRLLSAIVSRVSNRGPYSQTPVNREVLAAILAREFSGIKITLVTNRQDINFLAEQTEAAIQSIMGNPFYRKELSGWVRTNHTRQYDGMPGFTHGFGAIKSLVSKSAVRHLPKQGPQAKKSLELIQKSGALVIVSCTNNHKESFVNAGRLYSQICVLAATKQLSTSALGASVIDSGTRETVRHYFKIKDRPVYILRLGTSETKAQHSPRWPLEKVLITVTD